MRPFLRPIAPLYYLLPVLALGGALPAAAQYSPAAFGSTTPQSLPIVMRGLPVFSSGLLSFLGSVDYAGSPATLTGTTVIGGDLRLRQGSPLIVSATGKLYVYGNTYIQDGALTVQPGGQLFFYGNQFGLEPLVAVGATSASGGGTLTFSSPRPTPGQAADGQQRAGSLDGLAAGTATQYLDGGSVQLNLNIEHRSATGLTLLDVNNDGSADIGLSGTLSLGVDNAPFTLGNSTLLLDQTQQAAGLSGTITNYSPQRYIVTNSTGLLRVAGVAAGKNFVFPVGSAATGDYTPLQLTNRQSTPAGAAVSVTATAPAAPPKPSAGRYWRVVASDPSTSFDLTLEHNLATNEAGYTDNSAAIVRYDGSAWSTPAAPRAGTSPGVVSTTGPTAGSSDLDLPLANGPLAQNYFTKVSAVQAPLPVTLVSFVAGHVAGTPSVQLTWKTASELNNAGFEVERSRDAYTWTQVGYVAGHGTSTLAHTYALATPYVGASFYRLRQVDNDGTGNYSPVRSIAADATAQTFSAYPSPTAGEVNVVGADPLRAVLVLDMLGQVVATLPPGQTKTDLTGQLPTGVYVLTQGSQRARLVIK